MSKRIRGTVSTWTPKMLPILGTIIGVFLGAILDKKLGSETGIGGQKLFDWEGYAGFYMNDLVVTIIGLLLIFFGSRIHRLVKYIGFGILAYELGEELYEIATGEASF